MLRAHANMPAADFIAQLRTYVIAMGLSPQVVDTVDNLCGADDLEEDHLERLRELEDKTAKETKDNILAAVGDWASTCLGLSEAQRTSLFDAIRDA